MVLATMHAAHVFGAEYFCFDVPAMNFPLRGMSDEHDGDRDDAAKTRRRAGQSWFNGRRGVRNFLLVAAFLVLGSFAVALMLPIDLQCAVLPEALCRGSCSPP